MNSNLVIIATRDRPHNAVRAFEQLRQVSIESDFLMVINQDQRDLYPKIDGVITFPVKNDLGAIGKLNRAVERLPDLVDHYITITSIDDDCMVTTPEWDRLLAQPIKKLGYGISYGNDTMQGENLPTKVMISSNIVKALGFFAPPCLFHLYADNFWKALGQSLNALDYFPDVMMEHWHYLNGKAPHDELYKSIYRAGEMEKANEAFSGYMKNDFERDVERVQKSLKGEI